MLTFADVFTPSGEAPALSAALAATREIPDVVEAAAGGDGSSFEALVRIDVSAATAPSATLPSAVAPASLDATFAAIADLAIPFTPPSAAAFADPELEAAQKAFAELRRRVDVCAAAVAHEIDHRSRHELGYDGLAQRKGARTAVNLVQTLTGMTNAEARSLIAAGALLPVDGAGGDPVASGPDGDPTADPANSHTAPLPPAWLRDVGAALSTGSISVAAADEIRRGLRLPDGVVTEEALSGAAARLLREAPNVTVERLGVLARELRNELDLAGVLEREEATRDKRYMRLTKLPDGMTRVSGLLDPESAAIVVPILDAVTSPRRGGPRFVDSGAVARAEAIVADQRTTDQLTVDTFVQLMRMGSLIDDGTVLGHRKPTVRVLVTQRDLERGQGVATFEGQTEGVSIQTAERHICSGGMLPIQFDDKGQALNRGRERRFFTDPQRDVLAARDGGCRFTDCDRPPSWTEAHHINEVVRDNGLTNVDDGILLCRHHHMYVHNRGGRVLRDGADYFLVPAEADDPTRTRIPVPSKSATHRRLLATA